MNRRRIPFVIAEIGINHNGNINVAKQLIDVAKKCDCDAVKFQKRTPEICVPEDQKNIMRETPWGRISYLEYRHHVEFGLNEYQEIDRYCKQVQIPWFASAWDLESQLFLQQFDLKYNKIASAMIVYEDLLKMVALEGKHTFISTGMCNLNEISIAVEIFRQAKCPFELMQCVSTYPTDVDDINLACIKTLRDSFHCDVGYSAHDSGLAVSYAAVALGATSLERHITLDRAMYGSDQAASVSPDGLGMLVDSVRKIERALGNGEKKILEKERPIALRLRKRSNYEK